MGLKLLREISSQFEKPIIAIGGINKSNVSQTIRAGTDGAAIISAIVSADDISSTTRELKMIILSERNAIGR